MPASNASNRNISTFPAAAFGPSSSFDRVFARADSTAHACRAAAGASAALSAALKFPAASSTATAQFGGALDDGAGTKREASTDSFARTLANWAFSRGTFLAVYSSRAAFNKESTATNSESAPSHHTTRASRLSIYAPWLSVFLVSQAEVLPS